MKRFSWTEKLSPYTVQYKHDNDCRPESHLEEVAEWYKINGLNLLKSKIQKLKEEIGK